MRPAFIIWSSKSKFFEWWILLEVGGTCVADLLDNCAPWNGEGDDEFAVAVIKDSQIVGSILLKKLFTDYMVSKGFCCQLYYWEKEERKRLRSTMLMYLLLWIHKRPGVYLIPGVYFRYDAIFPGH